jgi:DMSO/TMAO reductase YedYZ molybdopterin-dependent catalytic subunit
MGKTWKASPHAIISGLMPAPEDDKPSTGEPRVDDLATTRPKLVEAKERWAREGRLLTGHGAERAERLPPGQHLVRDWPVLDLGIQPKIEMQRWRFRVGWSRCGLIGAGTNS